VIDILFIYIYVLYFCIMMVDFIDVSRFVGGVRSALSVVSIRAEERFVCCVLKYWLMVGWM